MVHRPWSSVANGTGSAWSVSVKANHIDDVVVYREAEEAASAVSAILDRPVFGKDFDLLDQLGRSSNRIGPLIEEGFGQLTDRHLATYLGRARGSAPETNGHLRKALRKRFISDSEYTDLRAKYVLIGKRLTTWIHYPKRSDWKDRG